MNRARWAAAWLWVAAVAAQAHSVTEEIGAGLSQPTRQNPRSGSVVNLLSGEAELSDTWSVALDLALTLEARTPPVAGAAFGSTGGHIFDGVFSTSYQPSDELLLSASFELSPRNVSSADAAVGFTNPNTGATSTADALLRTAASAMGGALSGSYVLGLDEDNQTILSAFASVTQFHAEQTIQAIQTASGPVLNENVVTYCQHVTSSAAITQCRALLSALRGQPASLSQLMVSAAATEVLSSDTELGFSATYFLYDRDPTDIGYFTVLSAGRAVSLGAGFPLAAPQLIAHPYLAHRFGRVTLEGAYQFTRYASSTGFANGVGLKATVNVKPQLRVWARLAGEQDVDASNVRSYSGEAVLGVRYAF